MQCLTLQFSAFLVFEGGVKPFKAKRKFLHSDWMQEVFSVVFSVEV